MTQAPDARGIHRVRKVLADKTVVSYHYAWRSGPRFWSSLDHTPEGGPAYWQAYKETVANVSRSRGLFREILREYVSTRQFQKRADRTKKDVINRIGHPEYGIDVRFGGAPAQAFNRPQIRKIVYAWHDDFKSDRVADSYKATLVAIVTWAVDRGLLQVNHLAGMHGRYSVDRSEIIWTPQEIDLFLNGDDERGIGPAPLWLQRLFTTALETGLRQGDIAKLNWTHIQNTPNGQRIFIKTAKRKRDASVPVTPRMKWVLDTADKSRKVIILDGSGQPYTSAASLGQAVARRRDLCGIRKALQLRDTRGTAATRLFEADASLREISAAMGWSPAHTAKMIETYVRMAPEASDSLLDKLVSQG